MAEIIDFYEYKERIEREITEEMGKHWLEHEQRCNALFLQQHADDDGFENQGEFVFVDKEDL